MKFQFTLVQLNGCPSLCLLFSYFSGGPYLPSAPFRDERVMMQCDAWKQRVLESRHEPAISLWNFGWIPSFTAVAREKVDSDLKDFQRLGFGGLRCVSGQGKCARWIDKHVHARLQTGTWQHCQYRTGVHARLQIEIPR